MIKKPLFIAVLQDETLYIGGDYNNTKWLDLPKDKKIKRLFISILNNDYLCLELYNNYYFMVEATQDMSGKDAGKVKLQYSYIMGKKEGRVTVYKISLQYTGNKKIGDVERIEYLETDEFLKKLNPQGWK